MLSSEKKRSFDGLLAAISAYSMWGFFSLYFTLLNRLDPLVILAFRIIFAFVVLIPIVLIRGKGKTVVSQLLRRKSALSLLVSSFFISGNWLIFIILVQKKMVLESSLGYFINPLVSVMFGVVFLRERLRPLTWVCVFLAGCGVSFYAYEIGTVPWGAMGVALTFACYGLVRKMNPTDSLSALTVETLYVFPIAMLYLFRQNAFFTIGKTEPMLFLLLFGCGVLTAFPLLLFGFAARRVRLSTLGMLQYLTPTFSFLCAIVFLGETMQWFQWVAFVITWFSLLLYLYDSFQPYSDTA